MYARCLKVEDRGKQRLDVALSRADALRQARHYQEAIDFLEDWKVYAAAESREGDLRLRLYECMALVGRVPEAIAGYRGLVEKFPRTPVAYEAQFRIGYLYEAELQDYDSAGREYDKLKGQPTSQFSDLALRRSQSLTTLRQYRQTMASDTTQTKAAAAFMLAELYYFQLDKPESALIEYRDVETQFPQERLRRQVGLRAPLDRGARQGRYARRDGPHRYDGRPLLAEPDTPSPRSTSGRTGAAGPTPEPRCSIRSSRIRIPAGPPCSSRSRRRP